MLRQRTNVYIVSAVHVSGPGSQVFVKLGTGSCIFKVKNKETTQFIVVVVNS
jgi:hypothetical protein